MKKTELVKAAKELNGVLGLDPQIEVKGIDKEELQVKILEAAGLLVPEDEVTEATKEVINTLTEMANPVSENETPLDDQDTPGQAATDAPAKAPKAPKAPKEPKEPKEPKVTKKSIVIGCLKDGATIEEMAQAIVDQGIDPDYKKNCYIVKLWLSKMGYDVKKAAIEANPIFRSK